MQLRDFTRRIIKEGGNMSVDGHEAQQIDLKVHDRNYIVPILDTLLNSINAGFQQSAGGPLWSPKVLKSRKYLSGSSLHFFNTDISDDEFVRVKPKVGDIDTQVNKDAEAQLAEWLNSVKGSVVGNAKFLGYSRGNEQYSSLWELTDPPIKVQIDFEFVDYSEKDEPTDWAGFSHSSSWDDLGQGIKGVFHKYLIQSLSKISSEDFILRKVHKRTGKITDKPERDSMLSFAVSSKEGGGLRAKYEPVLDEKGRPLEIDGLPVLKELPPGNYEKDISKIFQSIFGKRIDRGTLSKALSKTWSFTGLLELMNIILPQEEKEGVLDSFVDKLFSRGAQGLYKGDPQRDTVEKNAALNYALKVLGVTPPVNLEQLRQEYVSNYKVTSEGQLGLDKPLDEAEGDQPPAVKAQLRKGMPHLRDLKTPDFLDLLDEIHDGNGRFKLQNIPLNVKIDGFGGRFGKNADGKPFMGTSRTEPRYEPGFLAYHQKKGTTDPEVLGRAEMFDDLFGQMMSAVSLVDSKLGKDFLIDKQVTCEVLFLPFATETDEGKLKFVGISYDKLPKGVQLALVPFRVVTASTGEELPNEQEVVKKLTSLGRSGGVMFIDNSLTQQGGLDVTEILNPIENLDALKQIVSDTAGKRDRASLQLKKEVEEKLQPIKIALEKAIDSDPNIVGKDLLGQDYEGIVINSRLGPIKVTSTQQKDIIAAKNAAKANARTERPRGESKTAVVAIGSFVGHKGHEDLFKYTIDKAKELGGDPYLFIGNAEGKDDPIPPAVKVQTWHKLYPQYANNISTVQEGGSLIQKVKHELINPLPGKPPRYDNIVIMVGEDRAGLSMPTALMKAVNKFQGYEHVKVSLGVTPRESGFSGTALRNSLKNDAPEKALAVWSNAFDVNKLGVDWIKHLMDITKKGMGIAQQPTPQPEPVVEQRLFNSLVRPRKTNESAGVGVIASKAQAKDPRYSMSLTKDVRPGQVEKGLKAFKLAELSSEKLGQYKKAAGAQASAADKAGDTKKADKRFGGIIKATKKQFANDERGVNEFAPGSGGGESGRWYTDDQMTDIVGDGWWQDMDVSGNIAKRQMIQQAQAWLDDQGYSVQVLNCKLNDDDMEWFIEGNFHNPGFAKKGVNEFSSGGDDGEDPLDNYPCYDCGSTIFLHHTELCELAEENAIRDLPAKPGSQHWTGEVPKGLQPIPGLEEGVTEAGSPAQQAAIAIAKKKAGKTEAMLPNSVFAGTKVGQKIGSAGQWKNTGPSKNRPARAGDLVGGSAESIEKEEKQRLDPSCWKGYKKQGTKMKGGTRVNNCVPISEDVQNIMDTLINKIIFNEAIQNNK